MRVVVVGGGVVGCAISFRLAGRGHQVILLERDGPGKGATAASAGMIAPQAEAGDVSPLLSLGLRSRGLYHQWIEELREFTAMETGFARSGLVLTALSEAERAAQRAISVRQSSLGLAVELLDRSALVALAGPIAAELTSGVFLADECRVHPRLLAQALAAGARRRGAEIRTGVHVTGLAGTSRRATGAVTRDGPVYGDIVVLCAGCWTPELAPDVSDVPRGVPVRGQVVELEPEASMDGPVLYTDAGYLVPRGRRVLFGATTEYAGFKAVTTVDGVRGLLGAARRLCPWLGDAALMSTSAGLRPGSPDSLPTIGPSARAGLFLATGHYRNGVLLAPVTAELVADLIDGHPPPPELRPFLPARHRSAAPLPAR